MAAALEIALLAVLALLLAPLAGAAGGGANPWRRAHAHAAGAGLRLHFDARIAGLGAFATHGELLLLLEDERRVDLQLRRAQALPAALRERYPGLHVFEGRARGGEWQARVEWSQVGGLRAMLTGRDGERHFVEPVDLRRQVYRSFQARHDDARPAAAPWACDVEGGSLGTQAAATGAADGRQRTFRLALVANGEYARFHGNTVSRVLAELATLVNRVNGVFRRDLGVTFELHPENDKLVCLHPCSALPANDRQVLGLVDNFLEERGVPADSFDLAHTLTTGAGGVACLRSLCGPYKSCGTTGLPSPVNDAFYLDYVAHELGHQLGADHSFQDCADWAAPSAADAVEPGSGSTLMSYAGICAADKNLQTRPDPYFHAHTLEAIGAFLSRAAPPGGTCGSVGPAPADHQLQVPPRIPERCEVPVGNAFRVAFRGDLAGDDLTFTLEGLDRVPDADLYDRSQPRFRSWPPSARTARTFPSAYYLVNGLAPWMLDEVLPAAATSLAFRGAVRSAARPAVATTSDLQVRFAGEALAFEDSVTAWSTLTAGTMATVRWRPGAASYLASAVQVRIAENTMPFRGISDPGVVARDIHELDWRVLAEVDSAAGEARVVLPHLADNPTRLSPLSRAVRGAFVGAHCCAHCRALGYSNARPVQDAHPVANSVAQSGAVAVPNAGAQHRADSGSKRCAVGRPDPGALSLALRHADARANSRTVDGADRGALDGANRGADRGALFGTDRGADHGTLGCSDAGAEPVE